ncbi:hypothetical protein Poly41_36600 [Novipirellula artificiosorum]|uniref:Uncharacterized protein n=1 Tax=Novipirellula artificiosorum TaxID=2528016 RepID=A0A5C6DGY9_9BACT|nr:hypothetical protein Poly41_36600 [Novipirellula artificiosorum]
MLVNPDQLRQDPDAYKLIAETLSTTGVFGLPSPSDEAANPTAKATAFRPPLYPYVLSWLVTDQGLHLGLVGLLHVVLGSVTVACTLSISQTLIDGGRIGLVSIVAAGLVAVDPILLQQSSLVMTETLAVALASGVIWLWASKLVPFPSIGWAILLGLLLALAYLCRPTFLVWAVLLIPCLLWSTRTSFRHRMLMPLAAGAVVAVTVGAWTARNVRAVGHPVWATTHGGYTLLLANNPSFYEYLRDGSFTQAWDASPFLAAYDHRFEGDPNRLEFWQQDWADRPVAIKTPSSMTEHGEDQVAYEAAMATIKRQPRMFVWSCVVRLARLWTPMPHSTPARSWLPIVAVTTYYGVLSIAFVVGLGRIGRQVFDARWWAILTLFLTLSAVHAVYWTNMRMRSPATAGLAVIAARGLIRHRSEPNPTP